MRQVDELGVEALGALGEKLSAAVAANEKPPPDEVLASLPIPDASRLSSVAITTACDTSERDTEGGEQWQVEGPAAEAVGSHLSASRANAAGFAWAVSMRFP